MLTSGRGVAPALADGNFTATPAPVTDIDFSTLRMCCILVIAASACTILLGAPVLYYYRKFRSSLRCVFNDLAVGTCCTQMLLCAIKAGFAATTIIQGRPLQGVVCDASATLDQFFEPAATVMMTCFFFVLGYIKRFSDRRESPLIWFILSFTVSSATVAAAWAIMYKGVAATGSHFTQELGWCWLPINVADVTNVSESELRALHFFCAYVYSLLLLVVAIFAYLRLRCVESKNFSWGVNHRIIYWRFFGIVFLPLAAYAVGAYARFGNDRNVTPRRADIAASFLFPFCGAVNALVFLYTEGLIGVMFRRRSAPDTSGFAGIINALGGGTLQGEVISNVVNSEQERAISGDSKSQEHNRHTPEWNMFAAPPLYHQGSQYGGSAPTAYAGVMGFGAGGGGSGGNSAGGNAVTLAQFPSSDAVRRSLSASNPRGSGLFNSHGSRQSADDLDEAGRHAAFRAFHDQFIANNARKVGGSLTRKGRSPRESAALIDDLASDYGARDGDFRGRRSDE